MISSVQKLPRFSFVLNRPKNKNSGHLAKQIIWIFKVCASIIDSKIHQIINWAARTELLKISVFCCYKISDRSPVPSPLPSPHDEQFIYIPIGDWGGGVQSGGKATWKLQLKTANAGKREFCLMTLLNHKWPHHFVFFKLFFLLNPYSRRFLGTGLLPKTLRRFFGY